MAIIVLIVAQEQHTWFDSREKSRAYDNDRYPSFTLNSVYSMNV